MMLLQPDARRVSVGPALEEVRDEVRGRAERLLNAYEQNVSSLLTERGLQHGIPDPHGHIHDAQQLIRMLRTIRETSIHPYRWPLGFETPDHIFIVFLGARGVPEARKIPARHFDNPKRFVEAVEEILIVAQLQGL